MAIGKQFVSMKVGEQLGIYTVVGPLGAGGMGEVYRATDTKLDREVAIKVLPDAMAHDRERITRFEREAKVLASLNHPMIAAIYGFDQAGGKRFLVLELVEGPTLADRLTNGRLSVEESLDIARQMAEALEVAHEKGIIHRDLKPANVKVTLDGQVKVLDFGLAKALGEEESSVEDPGTSPTVTCNVTQPGVILGTPAYMSPEQARGRPVDKRSDIWSFGCVLYECLAGRPAFEGETIADLLNAVLSEVPDWNSLPSETPRSVKLLLQRLIVKDRKKRLRDIGDVSIMLADAQESSGGVVVDEANQDVIVATRNRTTYSGWIAATCLVLVSSWLYLREPSPDSHAPPNSPARLHVAIPESQPFSLAYSPWHTSVAISPDGEWIAYVGWGEPQKQLYYRRLDEYRWRIVPNSGGARSPFFSPNGEKLGFFTNDALKVAVLATNERPETLAKTIHVAGGACWEDDDTILYLPTPTEALTRIDTRTRQQEEVFGNPQFLAASHILPGGSRAIVAFVSDLQTSITWSIGIADFDSQQLKPLNIQGTSPHYDQASKRIVYANDGNILSAPFDLIRAEITGAAELLVAGVLEQQVAEFGVSRNGRMLYASGTDTQSRRLVSIDPDQPLSQPHHLAEEDIDGDLRLHPDDRVLAITVYDESDMSGIRLFHLDRQRWGQRITSPQEPSNFPVWSADGKSLTYMSILEIHSMEVGGTADSALLFSGIGTAAGADFPMSWHPDGDVLLYTDEDMESHWDIRLFDKKTGETIDFVKTEFAETGAMFSPDGNWVAYQSNAQGQFEIFIKPYPPQEGSPILASTGGGTEPVWSRNRDQLQLFYRRGQKMLSVDFLPGQTPEVLEPVELFQGRYTTGGVRADYAVDKDGRFYMVELAEGESPPELNIITDWNAKFLVR